MKKTTLQKERKLTAIKALIGFYKTEFEEDLSEFRASEITDFMLSQIGPSLYNQAIEDARKYMSEKIDDLDTEFYINEER